MTDRIETAYKETILESKPKFVKFTIMKTGKPTAISIFGSEKEIPKSVKHDITAGSVLDYETIRAMFNRVMTTGKYDEFENNGVTVVAEPLKENIQVESRDEYYEFAKLIADKLKDRSRKSGSGGIGDADSILNSIQHHLKKQGWVKGSTKESIDESTINEANRDQTFMAFNLEISQLCNKANNKVIMEQFMKIIGALYPGDSVKLKFEIGQVSKWLEQLDYNADKISYAVSRVEEEHGAVGKRYTIPKQTNN